MAIKKSGLGKKNLDVLLSASRVTQTKTSEKRQEGKQGSAGLVSLPVEQLQRGQYQPRKNINEESLQELADSIKAQGIIQPIVVRALSKKNEYEIIAGERRWRAAQLAGLKEVPVIIKKISDQAALAMALIENIQREDLNPVEEASSLQRLMDEFALTHQEVAETVGKSRTTVTNLLRLLTLNKDVLDFLAEGKLEMGHAKVLLALQGPSQTQTARVIAMKGLTVRETEILVKNTLAGNLTPSSSQTTLRDPNIRKLEIDLSHHLRANVKVKHQPSGKGKLSIHYKTLDELDRILAQLKIDSSESIA